MTLILNPENDPILTPKFRPTQTAHKRTFWVADFMDIFMCRF